MNKLSLFFGAILLTLLFLAGCSDRTPPPVAPKMQPPVYDEVSLPDDVFSIIALYHNDLIYIALNSNNEASIFIFNAADGKTTFVCSLENYLMNPANCTFLDDSLYLNYMTNDGLRKMISIDIENRTAKTIFEENDIAGLVYSASTDRQVFSLKHTQTGRSVVECYEPSENRFSNYIDKGVEQVIHAISVYNQHLYLLISDGDGPYLIEEYDNESGKKISSFDVSFAASIIRESQIGRFQMMGNSFYLMNFSGESAIFLTDGSRINSYDDWTLSTDVATTTEQFSLYSRDSALSPALYSDAGESLEATIEVPDGYMIRYAYSDIMEPNRVLISFYHEDTRQEIVEIFGLN